ncbi:DUF6417 family protein [Streptomyces ureilyticus]|uniref:DUF6417 family protein n=1 Tax=Streptomyces ureilyticus TaxID=1775131 RepID=UPI0019D2B88D|nr:DUF6417 family protein [Streptomyces ureilyticus]
MRSSEKRIAVLEVLHEHERAARHAWVVDDAVPASFQQSAELVVREGLAELADRDTRAELSVLAARPVRWAARLTDHGRDVLAFAHAWLPTESDEPQPGPGERLVELRPAQMSAVRVFIGLAHELATPTADGLAERVRTASFSRTDNRWRLCLTEEQITSVAYGLCLHRLTSSEAEANRFAREYGVAYRPAPVTRRPMPMVSRVVSRPDHAASED